jgi:hypothetical protein
MAADVKAVLNFAPALLTARLGVKVKTVDLTTSLESLSYFLARPQSGQALSRSKSLSRRGVMNEFGKTQERQN